MRIEYKLSPDRLSWSGVIPQRERSLVRLLVRAHAWAAGLDPGWGHVRGNQLMFLSHINVSPSLPFSLKINK